MKSKATLGKALTLMLLIIVWLNLSGQTNPTAQTLPYTQNFGTSGFSAMPTGMACWTTTGAAQATLATAESSTPAGNQGVTSGAPASGGAGGAYGHSPSSNGRVSILQSGSSSSQAVAAIVTTGLSSVTVTYSLVLSVANARDIGVVLQYRNGTTGGFTTISGSNVTYNSGTSNGGDADGAADFDNYTFSLPAAALNQAVVQLRWATWRGTQSGNSSGIGLDNISITGSATATPSIVASPTSITGLNYFIGSGPSAAQSTSVSATSLSPATAVVTVTAPSNFEVSVSGGGSWGTTSTLTASGGSIAATNVFFRLASGLSANTYNGTATLAGGTATNVSVTLAGTVSASSSSDIVANGAASAISSLSNTATISNNTQGTQVWSLTVRDGGVGLNDSDNLPTIVNAVTLTATSFVGNTFVFPNAIQSIAIFNGATLLANGVVSGTTNDDSRVVFTFASPLTVTDNASVNLDIRLSVKTNFAGVDNDDFVFIVSSGNVSSSASGSGFAAFTTFNSGNNIVRVQVVATELRFLQQPSSVAAGASMSPAVTVRGTNVYGYTDSDFVGSVSVTSGGTLSSTPATGTASLGIATFSSLVHTLPIDNITLMATAAGLTSATSSLFTVTDIPALSAGDILFTYANADGDGFEFITLKRLDLSALKFTDNGICSNGSFRKNEDETIITNGTSWTDVPQGTMIRVAMDGTGTAETNAIDGYIFSSTGTTSGLNAGGEQILGYLGASNGGADCTGSGSNTFVAGIDWGNTGGWTSGATASSNSKIPGTPTDFSTATSDDVRWYSGSVVGDAATISSTSNVRNTANWTGTSTGTAFNGTNLTIKNIQFNESNYTSGAVSVTNISCDATAVTVDCSALVFSNTTESTRYIIVANSNSAGSVPVDKYTCYSNVTGNFATAPTVVTFVSGQTKIDGCGTPTTGNGKVVYFDYRLRSNTVVSGLTAGQNYTFSVYAVNGNGLTSNMSSNTVSVSVTPAVNSPTITIGGATTACVSTTLTASGATSYQWSSGSNSNTQIFSTSGVTAFTVTGTDANNCTATTGGSVDVRNASFNVTLSDAGDNANIMQEECVENGWTYYGDPDGAESGKYYFAINWAPDGSLDANNSLAKAQAQVQIQLNNSQYGVTEGTGINAKGTWVMPRSWNIGNVSTPLSEPVSIRFFYDTNEYNNAVTSAVNFANTNGARLEPITWFKTVGIPYNPNDFASTVTFNATAVYDNQSIPLSVSNSGNINGVPFVEFSNITSFSGGSLATGVGQGNPLPIKLEYFRGEKNGEKANLTWRTQTEENSSHFVLERSANGTDFYAVGNVHAAGNSSSPKLYQWTDEHTLVGNNYYRLRQIDMDGAFVLSNVVVLNFESASKVSAFPNPFTDIFQMSIFSNDEPQARFELFDISGRLLEYRELTLTEGNNQLSIDGIQLQPGAYMVRVGLGDSVYQQVLVKTQF